MSCYLVELYTPNAAWQALPAAQRQQFLAAIGEGLGQLAGQGIELLSLAETDTAIAQASPHQFLGIWRFPDPQARDALLAAIEASGWYRYFAHVNAASGTGAVATHLAALAAV
ncbi:DUF6616 family protein [Comamonas koreensis]|uniref:DUF1330 domain-containing protein n=1 Tax=Comamonas koreensis TaxID=160825 RepID=A0AAW4Y1Y7_9BURK|nr:DUF6616 family protein [Comamonas koreensis]MCD2167979.1 hypothetical protein [Comamonas koreensis]